MKRFALLPLLALPAFAQPQSQPASQPVAASQPVEARQAPPKGFVDPDLDVKSSKTLTGVLTWHEIPNTKSVEAYEGVEFRINGEPVEPSEHVSRDALLALKDKKVEVVCTMRKGVVPGEMESYPINRDGSPAPRPDQCQVHKIALK